MVSAPPTEVPGTAIQPDLTGGYLMLVGGKGVNVVDNHGREYLDAVAGVGVVSLGYGRQDIVAVLADQAQRLAYSHSMRYANEPQSRLAGVLAQITPPGLDSFFFCSGGSEALDSVLKIVRQYFLEAGQPSRTKVIGRIPSFHGNTLAALAVGYHAQRRDRFEPLLLSEPHIEAPMRFHCSSCVDDRNVCKTCSGDVLRDVIEREGPETVAAFIAEPIIGAAAPGVTPGTQYYRNIREICDEFGVLFVCDEVMTGVGRTGRNFAIEHWDVTPDLMMIAKGIASGYASLAAVAVSQNVMQVIKAGSGRIEHNFTMAGNPLACAVGTAVIEAYQRERLAEHASAMGALLFAKFESLRRFPIVGDVRGRGLMLGIEFCQPGTNMPLPVRLRAAQRFDEIAREERLLTYPCAGFVRGVSGDAILLLPPLIIGEDGVEQISRRFTRSTQRLWQELRNESLAR